MPYHYKKKKFIQIHKSMNNADGIFMGFVSSKKHYVSYATIKFLLRKRMQEVLHIAMGELREQERLARIYMHATPFGKIIKRIG